MQGLACLALLATGALAAGTLQAERVLGGNAPPTLQPITAAGRVSPVGTWKWFVGPDITFTADQTAFYRGNVGVWNWTNEGARELRVVWKNSRFIDTLTLSEDGNHLQGHNNVPDEVYGDRINPLN